MKNSLRTRIIGVCILSLLALVLGLSVALRFDTPLPVAARETRAASMQDAGSAGAALVKARGPASRETASLAPVRGADGGAFSAAPGTSMRFDLESTTTSETRDETGRLLQSVGMELTGGVQLTVLARRNDELALELAFPDCRLVQRVGADVVAPEATARFAAALAQTVQVRMRRDGTTLGFRFAPAHSFEQRNVVRSLWASLRGSVPEALSEPWTVEEEDALGRVRCSYRLAASNDAGFTIERFARELTAPSDTGMAPPVFEGLSSLAFDRALGWIHQVELDETTRVRMPDLGWQIAIRQIERCTLSKTTFGAARDVDWDAAWEAASGAADAEGMAQASLEEQMRQRLENRTVEQLVAELQALLSADDDASPDLLRAREELAWLLRLDPDALAKLAEIALDPRLDAELMATLVDCVGRCGSPEAQELLAGWMSNESHDKAFRQQSVLATVELEDPSATSITAVAGLLGEETDPELRDTALLCLGALSHLAGTGSFEGSQAYAHVHGWKAEAEKKGMLPEWIEALGNTGAPEVVDAVRPYLVHTDPNVRASAVHALRLVFTTEATLLASERARADVAAAVRARAAEVLVARFTNEARSAVALMLDNDNDMEIRRYLVLALGTQLTQDATARALLEDVAATDPLQELRELAHDQLTGAHAG